MENRKRRVGSCAEKNRISNLPEHLIESILLCLPVQDAVKTSILSKSWRYRWTTMKKLNFAQLFSKNFAKNRAFDRKGFIRIINHVLFFHKGPILKFHLDIPKIYLDSFREVDQWMLFLSRNGVNELILSNSNSRYKLPCHVFSCLELTNLELYNCCFKPPLEFDGFPNLEELVLYDIDFGDNSCETQISLPQLKQLSMYSCKNVNNFNIKATKLQNLSVFSGPDGMLLQLLDSHNIKFLTAEKIPVLLPCAVSNLERLCLLSFQLGDLEQLNGALCLLRNSPNLKKLSISLSEMEPRIDVGPASNCLESPYCLDCTLYQLKSVKITWLDGSRPELLLIMLLLAHSPSLEKFTITPSRASDVKKRLDIAKDVMWFPRASPKAKIIYKIPEP